LQQRIEEEPLHFPNFRIENGKLYKRVRERDATIRPGDDWKLVAPLHLRRDLLRRYHDHPKTSARLGIYKTYNRIKQLCTWPKMKSDIGRYIARCRVCSTVKPEQRFPPGTMGMRHDIQRPWQMISCDLFGPLPRSGNGNEYVLVITDYFSKFPFFTPLRQATARKVIAEIEEKVFLVVGVPEYCIVDNGVQFGRSREFNEFLNNYGVRPYCNSLNTPQNNPSERVNRTMKTVIMSYIWSLPVGKLN
jgi:hypothetical protein